ncbi:MAG: carboxypeptidase regulatory-like domain-containing protein, partial [Clostridia bacterium]|nr:carboxypeptidase regulatory-like domain-containing protein [Clostridia bacterium]
DNGETGETGLRVEKRQEGVILRAYTQGDGSFEIPGSLPEGESLTFVLPEHMMTGEANGRMEIPYTVTCMIQGQVTVNGAPLEGVGVTAAGQTAVTDSQGLYRFSQLTAGTYDVTFELTGDMADAYAFVDGSRGKWQAGAVALNEETKEAQVNAEAVALGSVTLEASGMDGQEASLIQNGQVLKSGVFQNGRVTMSQLYPGDYQMAVYLPQGMMLASLNGYDFAQKGAAQWNLGVTGGQDSLYRLTLSALGRMEGGISWQESVPVTVTAQGVQEAWSLETQSTIAFNDLIPGAYTVSVAIPAGYGAQQGGAWTVQQGVASLTVQVTAEQTALLETLALYREGQVSGQVFEDQNANGVLDGGESAKTQFPVSLYRLVGDSYELYHTTATDDQGNYQFSNLMPGTYSLAMEAPAGTAFNLIGGSIIAKDGQSAPFQVGDGQQLTGMNGTLVVPTGLRAVVFWDSNENGSRGIYERAVAGITVSAVDQQGNIAASGTTNADGEVSFKQLLPGVYQVRFQLPEGYAFSAKGDKMNDYTSAIAKQEGRQADTDPITLTQGGQTAVAAGVVKLGFVSGKVWYDSDASGIMTEDEPGQAGVVVQLVPRRSGGVSYELVTDETGVYRFSGVRPGSYDLTVTTPEGMMFTRYSKTGRDMRSIFTGEGLRTGEKTIVVEAGKTIDSQNVGLVTGGVIEGIVFLDPDYDGIYQEGDEPLAGVELVLEKISTGDKMGSVTVDATGTFRFEALRGGNYRLKATLPDETVVFTHAVSMSEAGNWFEARDGRQDSTLQKLPMEDMEQKTVYVGAVRTGSISGTIYMDDNYTGVQDNREAAAANLDVALVDAAGQIIARDRSDHNGSYHFAGLVPGAYQVRMEAKDGYVFTKLGEGNLVTSLSDEGDGETASLMLAMGQNLEGVDGGLIRPGRVSGAFFNDANDNGVQDGGEGGLAGVTVTLVNQKEGTIAFQTVTGNDGGYSFNRVMPGSYHVRYDLPEGGAFAPVAAGGNVLTGVGLTAASDIFDFKTADQKAMPLAGGLILARLEGRIYEDLNGSGQYEEGERFLSGVRLTFEGQEQITGADGAFLVDGIRPGSYTLNLAGLENYVFTRNGEAIAPRGQNTYEGIYNAAAGQMDTGLMIGMVPQAQITGYIWMDEDLSGSWNEMDTMLSGMDVTLRDLTDGTTRYQAVTDSDGRFQFAGLVPGSYDALVELPAGCIAAKAGYATFQDNGDGELVEPAFGLSAGEYKEGLSAGIVQYTVLEGMAWQDEAGTAMALPGTAVNLVNEDGMVVGSMTTGEDGAYRFDSVLPGDYEIQVALPDGYLLVNDQDDRVTSGLMMSIIQEEAGATGVSYPIHVIMGAHESGLDIGAVKPGMLGDKAWLDENGNGLQDTTEAAMPGITVRLIKDGLMIHEAVTDIYGYYLFDNVYPSVYDVEILWHEELIPTQKRTDLVLLGSQLEESDETSQIITGVEIRSNVKNFNFDLGFALRDEGVKPEAMKPAPTQVWK